MLKYVADPALCKQVGVGFLFLSPSASQIVSLCFRVVKEGRTVDYGRRYRDFFSRATGNLRGMCNNWLAAYCIFSHFLLDFYEKKAEMCRVYTWL